MNNDMLPIGTTLHINPEDVKWEASGDLISRSALKKSIKSYADDQYAENEYLGEYAIIDIIDNAPTVEAFTEEDMKRTIKENFDIGYEMAKNKYERPQGEWIFRSGVTCGGYYKCNRCGEPERAEKNYCSNCGAKMNMRGDAK